MHKYSLLNNLKAYSTNEGQSTKITLSALHYISVCYRDNEEFKLKS